MIWVNLAKKYLLAELNADLEQISSLVADEIHYNGIRILKEELVALPRESTSNVLKFIDYCYKDKYIACEYEIMESQESTNSIKFLMVIKFNDFGKINYIYEYCELFQR